MKPSWAVDQAGAAPGTRRLGGGRPAAVLVAAVVAVVLLAALEALEVAGRDDLRPAVRALLIGIVALQLPLAWLALRRSSAAAMVLLLCGVMAVLTGLAGGGWAIAVAGMLVVVLVASSLRWFPTVDAWPS